MPRFEWKLHPGRSNADLAYERLREAIVSGHFAPGQRITEVGAAGLLGVSRTPVREAFLRLVTAGLLRTGTAGGIEVVDISEELDDIHLLREAAESVAARLAAKRATLAEVAAISDLAGETSRAAVGSLAARARLNERFHLAVAEAAHAPRVLRLVLEYRSLFPSAEQLGRVRGARAKQMLTAHLAVAEAIAARNADLAENRMRAHLRSIRTENT